MNLTDNKRILPRDMMKDIWEHVALARWKAAECLPVNGYYTTMGRKHFASGNADLIELAAREINFSLIAALVGAEDPINIIEHFNRQGNKKLIDQATVEAVVQATHHDVACVIMHSHIFFDAHKAGLITYDNGNECEECPRFPKGLQPFLGGSPVIVNDLCYLERTNHTGQKQNHLYSTLFVKHGAINFMFTESWYEDQQSLKALDLSMAFSSPGSRWIGEEGAISIDNLRLQDSWGLVNDQQSPVHSIWTNSEFAVGE